MSVSFGTNTNVVKKRVKFVNTNSSAAVTLYAGMPLCYQFDTTTNVLGWDKENSEEGTTTAEGYQNEGKFMIVDLPDSDNIHAFAGVAVANSWTGSSTVADDESKWLDVYIPNGAIVPVRTDVDCTVGRTILSVESASQELTVPLSASTARPVAIAGETVDRSETSGLTLAKLCPNDFLYQTGDGSSLICDDDATAAETVNTMNLYFAGTGGPKRGLYAVGEIAGAGHANYGMWKFRTYLSAAASQTVHTVCANLHFKEDAEITDSGEWASSPLYVTVETEGTAADLSGGSLAGIYFGYYVDESEGAPSNAYLFHCNNHSSYNWDGLIRMGAGDIGDSAHSATGSHVVGFDSDADLRKIPILIDSVTYYFLVGTPAETAD